MNLALLILIVVAAVAFALLRFGMTTTLIHLRNGLPLPKALRAFLLGERRH